MNFYEMNYDYTVTPEEDVFAEDTSIPSYKQQASEGKEFESNRGLISDILHGLWSGSGEAFSLYGSGLDSKWMQSTGEWIKSTQYAKPDEDEYYGTSGVLSEIGTEAARSLPISAPIAIGGIGGAAIGTLTGTPLGTAAGGIAGAGAAGSVLAKGIYNQALDRYYQSNPDGDIEDAKDYAFKTAAIETLTELASTGVDIFTAKLGGTLTKGALKSAVAHGLVDVDNVLGTVAKTQGIGALFGKTVGAGSIGGLSEVAAAKLEYDLDKNYKVETETPDYFKTFMIGMVAEAPFSAGAAMVEQSNQKRIRKGLEDGLKSDVQADRMAAVDTIGSTIAKASPEAAQSWYEYASVAAVEGPITLDAAVDTSLGWKKRMADIASERKLTGILKNPEGILKEAGIPTGTAKFSTNIYGSNPTPPPESSFDALLDKATVKTTEKKAQQEALWKQQNPTPEYIKPYSAYSQSAAMMEVAPDSNQVIVPQQEDAVIKSDPVVQQESPVVKQEAPVAQEAPIVNEEVLPAKEESVATTPESSVTNEDLTYSEEDLKGVMILMPVGKRDGKTINKKVSAFEVHRDIEEEIDLYKDILRCAKG